eukprot:gene18878-9198_t
MAVAGRGAAGAAVQPLLWNQGTATAAAAVPWTTAPSWGIQRQWKNTRSQLNRKARKNFEKKVAAGKARMPAPPKGMEQKTRITRTSPGQIIDTFSPAEWSPQHPFYTADGLKRKWKNFMDMVRSTYSVALMKKQGLADFNAMEFAEEAQALLVSVDRAFARKDPESVRDLLTDTAYMELRRAMSSKKLGQYSFHGEVERPRVVYTRSFKQDKDDKDLFTQVTVRVKTSQSLNNGPRKDVLEFIVLERYMKEDDLGKWRICGKLPPPMPKAIE